ncbi:MAG: hypothetical protein FGM14_07220 [Flavobacteriales bacterium]|nr:hypothetical protein [Flavobacteriales bacterium]
MIKIVPLIFLVSCSVLKNRETICNITKETGSLNIKSKIPNGIRIVRYNGLLIEELLIKKEESEFSWIYSFNNLIKANKKFLPEKSFSLGMSNLSENWYQRDFHYVQNCTTNMSHPFVDSIYFVSKDTITFLFINVSGPSLKKIDLKNEVLNIQDYQILIETYKLFNQIRSNNQKL